MKTKLSLIFALLIFLFSCKKDDNDFNVDYSVEKGVFICNQGNFMSGNASLSFFNTETKKMENQVFFNANNFPLGDVLQSIYIYKNLAYAVINNSGKIVVLDVKNFKHKGTISGLSSPRFISVFSDSKAFISDINSNSIVVFNPISLEKTGNIDIGSSSESMLILNNFLYVSSWSYNNKIFKIDISQNKVVDSLAVGKQPNSMVFDKNNKLWVLSDGGYQGSPYGEEKASLSKIDVENMEIELKIEFLDINSSPSFLSCNGAKDSLYFINGSWGSNAQESGIYKMSINDNNTPESAFIPENNKMFYALGVDPQQNIIYVSDAKDFSQKGWIYRYKSSGEIIDSFKVDIAPGYFAFKND